MKHGFAVSLFGMALVGAAQPAAADVYWSSISTACTPDSRSIQDNRYQSPTDGYVTPQAGAIDPIVLICGVAPNTGAPLPHILKMTYLDTNATPSSGAVKATLLRVNRTTGVRSAVATVSSKTFSATAVITQGVTFAPVLNFEAFYYYVRIDMDRTKANENIRSIGVALESPVPTDAK
jgi:hypothetical protein